MRRLLASLAMLALVAGACSKSSSTTTAGTTGTTGGTGTTGSTGGTASPSGPLTQLNFVLSFRPNSDVVPYAVGLQEGFYKDAGLDVKVLEATDPTSPLKAVAAGSEQMGYAFGPDLMFAAEQGLPLESVYAVMQTASFGIVRLASANIHSPADLKGKRVGITSIPIDQVSFDTLLASAGLTRSDVTLVDVGFTGQEALTAGKVDAISGLTWGEGATYTLQGIKWNFLPYHDYGVPDYQFEVIVTNRDFLQQHPDTVKAFLAATTKSMQFALDNPDKAVHDLIAQYPDLKFNEKIAVWNAIAKDVVSPLTQQNGLGYQDPAQWTAISKFFVDTKLISKQPDLSQVYTNDFYKG
jgi:ABC-type nitrate/sulfonate/bicarbonate transport system substrate-binding protein